MARLALANALPLQDAAGRALSGVLVQVRPHNDAFVAAQNVTGSLALTPTPVFVAPTGSTPIPDGTNLTASGTIAGFVEEGYYDLVVGANGSLPAPGLIRGYPFMDASGTAQIRASAVVTGMIADGTVQAVDMATGVLPATNPNLAYPNLLHDGIEAEAYLALTWNSASSVSIAAGSIWGTASGILQRFTPILTTLSGITAAANVRLDQVIFDANDGLIKRLVGTDTAGVTLANRTGVAALGSGQQRLWDLLVTSSGVNSVEGTGFRDCRRGCAGVRVKTVPASATASFCTLGGMTRQQYTFNVIGKCGATTGFVSLFYNDSGTFQRRSTVSSAGTVSTSINADTTGGVVANPGAASIFRASGVIERSLASGNTNVMFHSDSFVSSDEARISEGYSNGVTTPIESLGINFQGSVASAVVTIREGAY